MDLVPTSVYVNWKRYWQRKRYHRLDGATTARKSMQITRFGGSQQQARRVWKIKPLPKLKILKNTSPVKKLLSKAKNAYVDLMLKAGKVNTTNVFGDKRVPKGRQVKSVYPSEDFEKRLVFEIYKNLLPNSELSTM